MTARFPRPLVAGNWKMNGTRTSLEEARAVEAGLREAPRACDVMLCPPATLIMSMASVMAGGPVAVGGQDCHAKSAGAHTGDISAAMLRDAGASAVIVGHSERRADHAETSEMVSAKAAAAQAEGLIAIICVGETEAERRSGRTLEIVLAQVSASLPAGSSATNTVVAYEPVWAIGTGLTPTPADVAEVHAAIRQALVERFADQGRGMRILYGGSVKPSNASELMAVANVDGALVGGASLKANDFLGIIGAYPAEAS